MVGRAVETPKPLSVVVRGTGLLVAGLVFVALGGLSCVPYAGPDSAKPQPIAVDDGQGSIEAKLLAIDSGTGQAEGEAALVPYVEVLDSLVQRTRISSRKHIAEATVGARRILKDEGNIAMTCLEVMRQVDAAIPDDAIGQLEYDEVAAVWLALMLKTE